MTRLALAASALLLAACNTGFEPQYRVLDVRVLAIRSHLSAGRSADVAPGETLLLDALVANPRARSDLAVTWYACLPPASEAVPPCQQEALLADPHRLASTPGVISLGVTPVPPTGPDPTAVAAVAMPLLDPATIGTLTAALEFWAKVAIKTPTYRCRLYAELPVVAVAEGGGVRSTAVKKVRVVPPPGYVFQVPVDNHYKANRNPIASDVVRAPVDAEACTGGVSLASGTFPAGKTTICGQPDAASADAYDVCEPDGTVTPDVREDSDWQWYVTAGEFPDESGGVGDAQGGNVDFTRPGGPFWLWAILRDRRGGSDWITFAVSTL